ncbi:MAG: hypothetical protein IOD12_02910 [Silvanigrellales bacterium]|nr:hypothetical protein [Silvanigrellales bacterium]
MRNRFDLRCSRGQALLETLFVLPLFLVVAFGTVLVANMTQSRLERLSLEKRAAHSPSHFSRHERSRAEWNVTQRDVDVFLAEAKQGSPNLACLSPAPRGPRDVCLSSTLHGKASTEGALGGFRSLFPGLARIEVPFASRLDVKSPFLPGALTPYEERATHHGKTLALSFFARGTSAHPATHGGALGSRWEDDSGFNLSLWMATRVPARHRTPAGSSLSNDLEDIRIRTAGNARKAQAAACILESVYTNYGVGAIVELVSSAMVDGGTEGKGCPNAAAVANAFAKGADALLTAKAVEVFALEGCATAAIHAADVAHAATRCSRLYGSPGTSAGKGVETLFRRGIVGRYASGK